MGATVAERPRLSLQSALVRTGLLRRPVAPRYIVVPAQVWLGQRAATPEDDEHASDAVPAEEYYYQHPVRTPMGQAAASTAGGVLAAIAAGVLPGMLIGAPGGIVAGVAAGLFGGLMGRELAGELYERRHEA
ncbi:MULTISPECIES: hypothetical protein [unclassified Amycolatopsis]|uniref:hypothetical protein n=1 Tax=unclassified Amycolatopsis TaxID=2618356 RepID=UPI001FF2C34F|nr:MULTISPECIES: hypothetical protein [unclassified Amycolatopsis]UOZ07790.1 hypothetical protein MUY22_05730 [Amycolatopsis sp. WQ 127309]WSJ74047.1 hypothetical protein OG439_31890 [Amycolatopsis sp. NBC_01307]